MSGYANFQVDACGSDGLMNEELCARWMQVGSFMPMYRAYHNRTYNVGADHFPSEPFEWWNFKSEEYKESIKSTIHFRMSYTRHMYNLMYLAQNYQLPIITPHFFTDSTDAKAFEKPEHTFMVGRELKVTPVLEAGKVEGAKQSSYFPKGVWYSLTDNTVENVVTPEYREVATSFAHPTLHMRDNSIVIF